MFNVYGELGAANEVVTYGDRPEPVSETADRARRSDGITGIDLRSLPAGTAVAVHGGAGHSIRWSNDVEGHGPAERHPDSRVRSSRRRRRRHAVEGSRDRSSHDSLWA